jgi:hypothetical protein
MFSSDQASTCMRPCNMQACLGTWLHWRPLGPPHLPAQHATTRWSGVLPHSANPNSTQVDPVRVRRAAATPRLFMQRILQQFGAVGRPGGDSDEDEWEEDEEAGEDAAGPTRQRRRGTAQRPPPPQVGVRRSQAEVQRRRAVVCMLCGIERPCRTTSRTSAEMAQQHVGCCCTAVPVRWSCIPCQLHT